ncbi:MAG: hypothetical protein N2578_05580 [Bdellovibrionaceae bacterium]|nr:hypothetical protein [Pseudobdellovibrionaceae bacterium]
MDEIGKFAQKVLEKALPPLSIAGGGIHINSWPRGGVILHRHNAFIGKS